MIDEDDFMLRFEKFIINSNDIEYKKSLYEKVKHDATNEPYISDSDISFVIREKGNSYNFLVETLENDRVKYRISETRWFFDEERANAEYLYVFFLDPWELDGYNAETFGTQFEAGIGCPKCGKRKKVIEPIITDRTKMLRKGRVRYDIGIIRPEWYVSGEFLRRAKDMEFTGLQVGEKLVDRKGREMPDFYRIIFYNILPPLSEKSIILKDSYCKECGEGECYMNSEMIYDVKDREKFMDFNMTNEIFGYRTPRVIVSQRAYAFLKQFKICGETSVEPIYFL